MTLWIGEMPHHKGLLCLSFKELMTLYHQLKEVAKCN